MRKCAKCGDELNKDEEGICDDCDSEGHSFYQQR